MSLLAQSVLAGVTNGAVYGLIGMGLAVIFRGSRIVNAMQGEFSVIGGMATAILLDALQWPIAVAVTGGTAAGGAIGLLVERMFVRPMRRRGAEEDGYLLLTLGIAFTLSAATLYVIVQDARSLPGIGREASLVIFDAAIRVHAVWVIAIAVVLTAALRFFYTRTTACRALLAASIDEDGASTIGIDVARARTLTFALGGGVGALAGIVMMPLSPLHHDIGLLLTLKGFAAAILGGLANPFGAVVGGLVLGLAEALAVVSVSSGYRDMIALVILIGLMIVRPQGILARVGRRGG